MNQTTENLLKIIAEHFGEFKGAYNIRENGGCAARQSSEHIKILPKDDGSGIEIRIADNTVGETVFIPACITHSGVNDLVYNYFYVGENSDVIIVAGCGVHSEGEEDSQHNGIHRFFLAKNAKVLYQEKHIGTGNGTGAKNINPTTDIYLDEGSQLTMDSVQLGGVDSTDRKTTANLKENAKLVVRERILTDGDQKAITDFVVTLDGNGSGADLISRSVARGNSVQSFRSNMVGNADCTGHSECDAILDGNACVTASPALVANDLDAQLIHEAAIGKIAGEQLLKLRTLGLSQEEAEERIIAGFLA